MATTSHGHLLHAETPDRRTWTISAKTPVRLNAAAIRAPATPVVDTLITAAVQTYWSGIFSLK